MGSTQPLTEMSTRNLPGGKGRPARKADNLTAICGASLSHSPIGLHAGIALPYLNNEINMEPKCCAQKLEIF
jgi:hypothetical protein